MYSLRILCVLCVNSNPSSNPSWPGLLEQLKTPLPAGQNYRAKGLY